MFKNHEPEGPQLHSALKEIKAAIEVVEIVQCFETMEGEPDTIRSWHLLDVTEGLDFSAFLKIMEQKKVVLFAPWCKEVEGWLEDVKGSKGFHLAVGKCLSDAMPTLNSCREFMDKVLGYSLALDLDNTEKLSAIKDFVVKGDLSRAMMTCRKASRTDMAEELTFLNILLSLLKRLAVFRLARCKQTRKERKVTEDWSQQLIQLRVAAQIFKLTIAQPVVKTLFPTLGPDWDVQRTLLPEGKTFSMTGTNTILDEALRDADVVCTEWAEDANNLVQFVTQQMPQNWDSNLDKILTDECKDSDVFIVVLVLCWLYLGVAF